MLTCVLCSSSPSPTAIVGDVFQLHYLRVLDLTFTRLDIPFIAYLYIVGEFLHSLRFAVRHRPWSLIMCLDFPGIDVRANACETFYHRLIQARQTGLEGLYWTRPAGSHHDPPHCAIAHHIAAFDHVSYVSPATYHSDWVSQYSIPAVGA